MHPFSTPLKHQKTLRFSNVLWVRERLHWERMDQMIIKEVTFFKKWKLKAQVIYQWSKSIFFFQKNENFQS